MLECFLGGTSKYEKSICFECKHSCSSSTSEPRPVRQLFQRPPEIFIAEQPAHARKAIAANVQEEEAGHSQLGVQQIELYFGSASAVERPDDDKQIEKHGSKLTNSTLRDGPGKPGAESSQPAASSQQLPILEPDQPRP